MSIQYCEDCDKQIDTDFDCEHFEMHKEKTEQCFCKSYYDDDKIIKPN